jgi:hypothetical protein
MAKIEVPESWQPPKMPVKLKDCIALAFKTRAKRKKLEAEAERVKKDEDAIKLYLVDHFKTDEFSAVKVSAGTATKVASEMPQIDLESGGWGALQKHIQKTGEFDLLEKRLGVLAARERWAAGQTIPGIKKFVKVEIKLSEAK